MKKIIIILSMLTLFGCGTDTNQNSTECFVDHDCGDRELCLNNVCVFEPECTTNDDCLTNEDVCSENYTCINFLLTDKCLNIECVNDCENCGKYTSCEYGTCISSCEAYQHKFIEYTINACAAFQTCTHCICAVQGLQEYNGTCTDPIDISCDTATTDYNMRAKDILENFENIKDIIDHEIEVECRI